MHFTPACAEAASAKAGKDRKVRSQRNCKVVPCFASFAVFFPAFARIISSNLDLMPYLNDMGLWMYGKVYFLTSVSLEMDEKGNAIGKSQIF